MLVCERCRKNCGNCEGLWTWRDPNMPVQERYHGHGILSICADCLVELGGPDYRGMSPGQVLSRIEQRRVRGKKAPAKKESRKTYEVTVTTTFVIEASNDDIAQQRAEAVVDALVSFVPPKPTPKWWPDLEAPEIEIGEGE